MEYSIDSENCQAFTENSSSGISEVVESDTEMTRRGFGRWLEAEISARGWTQAELARRAHVAPAQVNRVLTSERGAGFEFYKGVAKALGVSIQEVYRRAGLLPSGGGSAVEELVSRLDSLHPSVREQLLQMWRANLDMAAILSAQIDDAKALSQLLGRIPTEHLGEILRIAEDVAAIDILSPPAESAPDTDAEPPETDEETPP